MKLNSYYYFKKLYINLLVTMTPYTNSGSTSLNPVEPYITYTIKKFNIMTGTLFKTID